MDPYLVTLIISVVKIMEGIDCMASFKVTGIERNALMLGADTLGLFRSVLVYPF